MSFPKNDQKIRSKPGKMFPAPENNGVSPSAYAFAAAIAAALHRAYGEHHAGAKTVAALLGANERAVRNWFDGKNGPSGERLTQLIRHSDEVLEAVLMLAARERSADR